jgi:hypothetical protein
MQQVTEQHIQVQNVLYDSDVALEPIAPHAKSGDQVLRNTSSASAIFKCFEYSVSNYPYIRPTL